MFGVLGFVFVRGWRFEKKKELGGGGKPKYKRGFRRGWRMADGGWQKAMKKGNYVIRTLGYREVILVDLEFFG